MLTHEKTEISFEKKTKTTVLKANSKYIVSISPLSSPLGYNPWNMWEYHVSWGSLPKIRRSETVNEFNIDILLFENNKIKKVFNNLSMLINQQLEMHKIYDNVFLTVSKKDINLFEISETNNSYTLENKIRIETDRDITLAKFTECNEKIIGAVSDYNLVRLWNIDLNFNYITIKPECEIVKDLLFNKN